MATTVAETKLTSLYNASSSVTNCSGFLVEVTAALGVEPGSVPAGQGGGADKIIDYITTHSLIWEGIGSGIADAGTAAKYAGEGYLVVALLKAADHTSPHTSGHVAFVLPPPLLAGYPRLVCGSNAGNTSNGNRSVYVQGHRDQSVWGPSDAPKVKYYKTKDKVPDLTGSTP